MRLSSQANAATSLLAALLLGANTNALDATSQPSSQVKGYYPSYNFKAQRPSQLDWSAYTDVLYFMVIPQANFTLTYDPKLTPSQGDELVAEFVAQARKHNVNPLFSTGGWTGSQYFSILSRSDESRKRFAQLLVGFGKKHGFKGIEMDWEYPNGDGIGCNTKNPNDVVNFGKLVKEIRALWPEASLTAAYSINGLNGPDGKPATKTETALLVQYLNYINLMAYDVFGGWAQLSGPIAPLYDTCAPPGFAQSVETGVHIALEQGFRPSQIVVGIPGYAKRYGLISPKLQPKTVDGQTTLHYQKITHPMPPGGKFDDKPGKDICGVQENWGGSFLVNELISNGWLTKNQKAGANGYKRYFDACSGEPFLSNGTYLISYDDEESTVAKAKFAKQHHLAGIYFFDTMGQPNDTVRAAGKALRN